MAFEVLSQHFGHTISRTARETVPNLFLRVSRQQKSRFVAADAAESSFGAGTGGRRRRDARHRTPKGKDQMS